MVKCFGLMIKDMNGNRIMRWKRDIGQYNRNNNGIITRTIIYFFAGEFLSKVPVYTLKFIYLLFGNEKEAEGKEKMGRCRWMWRDNNLIQFPKVQHEGKKVAFFIFILDSCIMLLMFDSVFAIFEFL